MLIKNGVVTKNFKVTFTKAIPCVYLVIRLVSEMFSALKSSSSLIFFLSDNSATFNLYTTFLPFYLLASLFSSKSFPSLVQTTKESKKDWRIRRGENEKIQGSPRKVWELKRKTITTKFKER